MFTFFEQICNSSCWNMIFLGPSKVINRYNVCLWLKLSLGLTVLIFFHRIEISNSDIFIYIAFTEPNIWTCKIVFHYRPSFLRACRPGVKARALFKTHMPTMRLFRMYITLWNLNSLPPTMAILKLKQLCCHCWNILNMNFWIPHFWH